jgi:predicted dehydrogenase
VTDPVRIAVVGAGLIGYQHILRVRGEPEAVLAAIVDPTVKAQELARDLGTRWFPDLHAMLEAITPDGVIVATPNQLHVANGLTCVAAGIPMLMEKPVSDDVATGWELVAATEQAGVPMLVGHHRRHSPLIQQARESIASGAIGRVTTVNGLCWFLKPKPYFDTAWRREPGAGVILINLTHVIDDLRNLCGDVESVQALVSNAVRRFPVEDTAAILLRFRSGALGTVSISDTVAAPWSWELTSGEDKAFPHSDEACYLVGGTEGAISVPRLEQWRHTGDQGWRSPIQAERRIVPEQDPLVLQLRQFCRVVRREEPPLLDGREAMKTLEATLAVKESATTGTAVGLV